MLNLTLGCGDLVISFEQGLVSDKTRFLKYSSISLLRVLVAAKKVLGASPVQ